MIKFIKSHYLRWLKKRARRLPKCACCGRRMLKRSRAKRQVDTWMGAMTITHHKFCWYKQDKGVLWCWKNGIL